MAPDALVRLWAAAGIAATRLRYERTRTALAVLGVGLAVLLVVLLGGVGYGTLTTGDRAIGWFENDLWVTGGAVTLEPTTVGGVANPIDDAHERSADLESIDGVANARPVAFQTVYVSPDGEEFDTTVGVGLGGDAGQLRIASRFNRRDLHYANGSYDGPMTNRIVVGPAVARRYGLSEGDTLHVGGTIASARDHEFTVVGITGDASNFLGTPTVGMHLSELQEVSGTTGRDPAAVITVTLAPGADADAVTSAIERRDPSLEVRTSDEQVRATVGRRAPLLASAAVLVLLAVVSAVVLVLNVLALLVRQQREQLAALAAAGVSTRSLVGLVTVQGAVLGLAGGIVGVTVALPAGVALDRGIGLATGYAGLVRTPVWLFGVALVLAVSMGVLGAVAAGWYVARLDVLDGLRA